MRESFQEKNFLFFYFIVRLWSQGGQKNVRFKFTIIFFSCQREHFFAIEKIFGMCLGAKNQVVYCANETEFFIIPLTKANTNCMRFFNFFTNFRDFFRGRQGLTLLQLLFYCRWKIFLLNIFFFFLSHTGNKCFTKNLEDFFLEILLSSSLTKWFLDGMEFLRTIRLIFKRGNFSVYPKNIGCIRTLDSISFDMFNETCIKQNILQIAKRYL